MADNVAEDAVYSEGQMEDVLNKRAEANININEKDKDGFTALMVAVKIQAPIEIIQTLLDEGADINAEDDWAYNALDHAVENNYVEAAKLFIEKGADVNRTAGYDRTALMIAAEANSADAVKLLLDNGAQIDVKDTMHNWSALMHAAAKNSADAVRVLMKHGANASLRNDPPNPDNEAIDLAANPCFNTALTIAASKNSLDALKALIDCGADINIKDNQGSTALDIAKWYVREKHKGQEMIDLLKDARRKLFLRKTLPILIAGVVLIVIFSMLSK